MVDLVKVVVLFFFFKNISHGEWSGTVGNETRDRNNKTYSTFALVYYTSENPDRGKRIDVSRYDDVFNYKTRNNNDSS